MNVAARIASILRAQLGARRDGYAGEPSPRRPPAAAPPEPAGSPAQDPELARYYANLELPYGADLDAVHAAWRRLMRRYHPDRHQGRGAGGGKEQIANELVQGLNHAYRQLCARLEAQRG